jgi:anti-sigma regulatory factor (Ser/Thr protein kinase)
VPGEAYRHDALLYAGPDDLAAQAADFVRAGLRAGEAILVALPAARLARVREALGSDADGVEFADMEVHGRNPGRLVGLWRQFIDAQRGRPARGIGEPVWAGRGGDELVECQHHEALLNVAFAPSTPFWLVCPYDITSLEPETVEAAMVRHPHVCAHGRRAPSERYDERAAVAAALDEPLAEAPRDAEALPFGEGDLAAVRPFVGRRLGDEGVPESRGAELVLAVHEVAANSVCHGGGRGMLRLWEQDDRLVCEVQDAGRVEDPLVGRRPPSLGAVGGRGVWLAHQLCDLVQLRSGPAGTTVRLSFEL